MSGKIMSGKIILFASLIFLLYACDNRERIVTSAPQLNDIPWNLAALEEAPEFRWLNNSDSVHSLLFTGETYHKKPTEVFAYYGSPSTFHNQNKGKYPGIVLVHGGGGTAFKWWVKKWVEQGYAAIAIDFGGHIPVEKGNKIIMERLKNGGPEHNNKTSFYDIDSLISDQWQFHAVSAIIRAHSLIRSFEEVDENNTALTGISWGGYLTCIVSGVDSRFNASVPVYGSGFLHEGSYWKTKGIFESMSSDQITRWENLWDPSRYIPFATIPILFVNGTNDRFYYLENFNKTANLAAHKKIKITLEMKHGHNEGAGPGEIFSFINHYTKGTPSLPEITDLTSEGNKVKADVKSVTGLESASLIYTRDIADNDIRKWIRESAGIVNNSVFCTIPSECKAWFIEITDSQNMSITSNVYFTDN